MIRFSLSYYINDNSDSTDDGSQSCIISTCLSSQSLRQKGETLLILFGKGVNFQLPLERRRP